MPMPVIGLVPLVDAGRESYWMLPGYMDGITEAGGVPVMLPLTDDAQIPKEEIYTTKVRETWIGGKCCFALQQ